MSRLFMSLPGWLALFVLCQTTWSQAAKPEAMITRTFKVPRDFVSFEMSAEVQSLPADPFATLAAPERKPGESVPLIKTARDRLEEAGLIFPDGASASFDPWSSTLTLINTQANQDLCEAYFEHASINYPHHVTFVLTVLEGPGEIIRQANAAAAAQEDAAKALADLMQHAAKPQSQVHVVQDAFMESRPGMRVTTRSVKEHYHPTVSTDDQGRISVDREMLMVGMNLEIEPVIDTDNLHVDFNYSLDLHPSPPVSRQVAVSDPATGSAAELPFTTVPKLHFAADTQVLSGSTRLLGVSKPYGKAGAESEDVLWAAFITTHIVRLESLPRVRPKVKAAPLKVPSGMKKFALPVQLGLLENVLHHSGLTLQQYLDKNGVAPAPGADAVMEGDVLTVVNTHENLERIVVLIEHLTSKLPKTVALTLDTVQGSADFLRGLAVKAASQKDHGSLWLQVQEALNAGRHDLKHVSTSRLETRSGVRSTLESVQEHTFLSEFGRDEKGRMGPQFEIRRVGSILDFEPTITWDGCIDPSLSHELHLLPPQAGRGEVLAPGSKVKHDFPIEDLHVQQTVTHMHMEDGGILLHSLVQPPGAKTGDQLIATFLRCDVIPQSSRRKETGPTLAQMLASVPKTDSQELWTRSFRVAPDFLSTHSGSGSSASGTLTPRKTARQILEDAGISFPEGSSVSTGNATSEIIVRNTAENLDKVEQFVKWMERETRPSTVTTTSHVLEAPGPLVRRLMTGLGTRGDHRAELKQLLDAVRQGKVRHLGLSRIETRAGANGKAEQGVQHPFFNGAMDTDVRLVGFSTEVEVISSTPHAAPGFLITSEFHPAPPVEHREYVIDFEGRRLEFPLTDFYVMKLKTETVVPDGQARLLAVWKPVGKGEGENADLLQVLFITCDEVLTQP
ncbi:MAG: hypothetical protein WAW39_27905 [Prosthecobacter sp.]|uniref:hypothetical protein n=1 Tax=Prosthecobacter sp. TaxID=1965333 RepID=UPI003BB03989